MCYNLEVSLQNIALVKISSILWNQKDIRALIEDFTSMTFLTCVSEERKAWKNIEEKVLAKLKKLRQPGRLKEKISGFVRPMGWEIFKWIEYHCLSQCAKRCYLTVHMPIEFVWTPYGTVDRRETAKILIRDRTVDIATRYKLAYIYCLEDEVEKVWDSVPQDYLCSVYSKEENPGIITLKDLVFFWTGLNEPGGGIKRRPRASSLENAFRNAVDSGSKAATEYFLKQLTPSQRDEHLVQAGQDIPDVEVLCFLLSEMDEEQRMKVFQSSPYSVMLKIFNWPYMSFFVETANRMWDSLNRYNNGLCFTPLTALIISYATYGYEAGIYQNIFKELWRLVCQRYGADNCANANLVASLFYIKDKENIRLIFRDASTEIKEELIWSSTGFNIGKQLIKDNDKDLLDFFTRECLPKKREIKEYKKKLKEYTKENSKEKYDLNTIIDDFFMLFR